MMIKHFLLTLLIIFAFNNMQDRTAILIASANLKSKQESLHSSQQSNNNTLNDDLSFNINLDDLKTIQELPKDSDKESSETENLLKALSDDEELKKMKVSDLKINEDSDLDSQSCEDIKKLGQQKEYCERKFLLSEGEEKTVECMKEFCSVCCDGNDQCQASCSKSHALFSDHDPEDMFINVCSYKNMGPSFEGFCKSMIIDDDKKEYEQCISNFCFDCCSNELKINDFKDPEINKCLGQCKPPQGVDLSQVPGAEQIKQETAMITEELKKLKYNPQEKDENETNKEIIPEKDSINQDMDNTEKNSDKKDGNEKSSIKVLVDFTKKNPTLTQKKSLNEEQDKPKKQQTETKDREIKVNKIEENSKRKVEDNSRDRSSSVEAITEKTVHMTVKENQHHHQKENLVHDSVKRKRENLKICESLILAFTNIKQFGKNINNHCISNYAVNLFETSNDCLKNLCGECCNFLEVGINDIIYNTTKIDKKIKTCLNQCNSTENKELAKSSDLNTKDLSFVNSLKQFIRKQQKEETPLPPLIPKVNMALQVPAIEIQKKIAENSGGLISSVSSVPMNYNMIHFSLIRSLCNTKYFRNCQETMCSEYCNDSLNIINQKCLVECTKYTSTQDNEKNYILFDYILKKHGYYEAKHQILNHSIKSEIEATTRTLPPGSHLNSSIEQKKEIITKIKSQLVEEEKALLNLYKMNKN